MTDRSKTPIEHTLKRLFGDTNHVAPEALLFGTLAWVNGWSQPVSGKGGANSWSALDDKGEQIRIRYSHENGVIELFKNGINGKKIATLTNKTAVLKFFKVKP